ncbi:MAG: hypothetical protein KGQ89_09390, partial [Verrucomicrobia bacterium]|nr:hypothetical protein [Verrucomicrobiota bacterium]
SEISENQLPNQVLARPESPHIDFERNFKSDRLLAVGFIPRTLVPEIFPCRIATPQNDEMGTDNDHGQ